MVENRFALETCTEACLDCSEACLLTAAWCLESGSNSVTKDHVTQLQLCAETCQLAAKSMILESSAYADYLLLCGKIADRCAEACSSSYEPELEICAGACRETAMICRALTSGVFADTSVVRIGSHFRI